MFLFLFLINELYASLGKALKLIVKRNVHYSKYIVDILNENDYH